MENKLRGAMTLSADCPLWQKKRGFGWAPYVFVSCLQYVALTDEEHGNRSRDRGGASAAQSHFRQVYSDFPDRLTMVNKQLQESRKTFLNNRIVAKH